MGRPQDVTRDHRWEAVGYRLYAVERVRLKMMPVVAIMASLLSIMWGSGTGLEVMRRIAAPMIGGMVSSTVLTLIVIPAISIYTLAKEWSIRKEREK